MAEGCLAVSVEGLGVKSTCGVGFTVGADPSAVVVEVDLHGVRRWMLHA